MGTPEQEQIEGFTLEGVSDGERLCTGCWDKSGYDIMAEVEIPEGQPIYWQLVNTEYGEYDAYCQNCAREIANTSYEDIS